MPIKGIAHAAFTVADMEVSLKFYCEVLGCTDAFETRDDDRKPWIRYVKVCEGQFIELFYGGSGEKAAGSYSHLCLEVEDIEAVYDHIVACGVTPDTGIRQGKDHNWQCWVRDPDGNRIELMQMVPESPQKNC